MVHTVNLFQPSVAFLIETSHLFCRAKQITGFYMKRNTGLKWVNNTIQISSTTLSSHLASLTKLFSVGLRMGV